MDVIKGPNSTELFSICEYERIRNKAQLIGLDLKRAMDPHPALANQAFWVANERPDAVANYMHLGWAESLAEAEKIIDDFCYDTLFAAYREQQQCSKSDLPVGQKAKSHDYPTESKLSTMNASRPFPHPDQRVFSRLAGNAMMRIDSDGTGPQRPVHHTPQ